MKTLLLLFLALPFTGLAQTTHTVQVVGGINGIMPAFEPANITINLGDEVEWVCAVGTHNVYAELDSFPDNPAPFSSAPTAQPSPWTFAFTFTQPGLYHYACNGSTMGMSHWPFQQGTVLVVDPSGVAEVKGWGQVSVFPIPAMEALYVRAEDAGLARCDLLSMEGVILRSVKGTAKNGISIPLDNLQAGSYLLRITDREEHTLVRQFVKF